MTIEEAGGAHDAPSGQGKHVEDCAGAYVPEGHESSDVPPSHEKPAGHSIAGSIIEKTNVPGAEVMTEGVEQVPL